MRVYQVGGAVRDALLGLPVADRDWVVVGATPEAMTAAGYRPVGRDFPVFLHPRTHEEYALARTERKLGRGYRGFVVQSAPTVTLAEDLARRDLTINAIAQAEDGTLIDPYGGQADLVARVLRHVSPAFVEDPVRILRVARFAARFADFSVAEETRALMRRMVVDGEVDALVPERVWQELSKGLMAAVPSRMIEVLRDCGALARLLPAVDALAGVPQRAQSHPEGDAYAHTLAVIDAAAQRDFPLPVRLAALLHDVGKALTPLNDLPRHPGHEQRGEALVADVCARWRVPADCRELARLTVCWHGQVHRLSELDAAGRLAVLEGCDAIRRPERFAQMLMACEADYFGRTGVSKPYHLRDDWLAVLAAVRAVDAGAIARACDTAADIPAAIAAARRRALSSG